MPNFSIWGMITLKYEVITNILSDLRSITNIATMLEISLNIIA